MTAEKRCSRCKNEKPREAFPPDLATPDGLSYWCRQCKNDGKNEGRRRRVAERQSLLNVAASDDAVDVRLVEPKPPNAARESIANGRAQPEPARQVGVQGDLRLHE